MNPQNQTKRLLDLQGLLNQFYQIERQIIIPGGDDRHETDTEHSYHLAMHAWYLSTLYPHLDQSKLIRYALAHDLVEIYAGDVMALGRTAEQQAEKEQKERAALDRLQAEWPDFSDMTDMIERYEAQSDPEAIFVKAFDKLMPIFMNLHTNGRLWKKLKIRRSVVLDSKDKATAKSPEITELWRVLREQLLASDDLFDPDCLD